MITQRQNQLSQERSFYLFLMVSAYVSTLSYSIFYFVAGALIPAYIVFGSFILYVIFSLISRFSKRMVLLFRLSILLAVFSFGVATYYTGGSYSPCMTHFIIPPLLAFFYKPINDRYYFMAICGLAMIFFWVITLLGYTENLITAEYELTHNMMTYFFVFTIVTIFSFLFRSTLANKNKILKQSMIEIKETTQKLIEAEKMASLGMLSAGVAHEINNPLNFIKGGIDMLAEEFHPSKDAANYLAAIDEGVRRASSIVKSLGHFSRSTDSLKEACNIHEIINNCLVMLDHKMKFKVTVTRNFGAPQDMKVIGNEGKLHQAILNILSNAENAIEKKGTITITTSIRNNRFVLDITDDGVGITEENLRKINEPFFTTKEAGKGTGLGLSITYKIIQEHEGKISVNSKPEKGTTFTISFPAVSQKNTRKKR